MKSNIIIEVDFLAGTSIKDAVTEAKEKAKILGVAYVCFSFNRVKFSIGSGANVNKVVEEYHATSDQKYGICAS